MTMTKKEKELYRREWNKANYARIGIYVRPEIKERWQEAATKAGYTSLNSFVIHCVESIVNPDERIHTERT